MDWDFRLKEKKTNEVEKLSVSFIKSMYRGDIRELLQKRTEMVC